jgi:hypothetical protein
VQAERSPQVLPFLREGIRQPRQSADLHPHGEVLPLNNRSADALRIGSSDAFNRLYVVQ